MRQWFSSSGKVTPQSTSKATAMARTVMETMTTTRVAWVMVTGAMRAMAAAVTTVTTVATVVAMVATMTPNWDEDNKDGNSNNNDKATMTTTMTTEGGGCHQFHVYNPGGGCHRPRYAAISSRWPRRDDAFVGSSSIISVGKKSVIKSGPHRDLDRWPANRSRSVTK